MYEYTALVGSFDKLNCFQGVISGKLKVFEHDAKSDNVAFICRYFGISRDALYQ